MRHVIAAFAVLVAVLPAAATPAQAASAVRARDLVPAEGLVPPGAAAVRDQAALNAHYYLADEAALGLGPGTDAVIAAYRTEAGDALLFVAAYPSAAEAARIYERFGRDFFSEGFDPRSTRFLERIETEDWAGALRQGRVLVVVLEAPDEAVCDGLLRRAAEKIPGPETR